MLSHGKLDALKFLIFLFTIYLSPLLDASRNFLLQYKDIYHLEARYLQYINVERKRHSLSFYTAS